MKWALLALFILAVVVVGLWAAYTYDNDWTGFRAYQPETGSPERGKTLWDWLDLLIIPAVLGFGALLLNRNSQKHEQGRADRENEIERQIASDRNQEAALQAYLDRMTDLLLKEKLRESQPEDEVRTVARTRTLTVLRGLGPERKSAVVRFLIETDLLSGVQNEEHTPRPVIALSGADLRGADLHEANLSKANLSAADLRGANLSGAQLSFGFMSEGNLMETSWYLLSGADLRDANLSGTNLSDTNLRKTNLRKTNLVEADLSRADLSGADLVDANLNGANLTGARFDERTILPDGSDWTRGTDMSRFTQPARSEGQPKPPPKG